MTSKVTRRVKGQDGMRSQIGKPEETKETSEKNGPENLWEIKLITNFFNLF